MSERWSTGLFVLMLLGQLLLLSTRPQARDSTVERLTLGGVVPIAHAASSVYDGFGAFFRSFRTRRTLREENLRLRLEVDAKGRELMRLKGVEEELRRLSRQKGYTRHQASGVFLADVVFTDYKSWLQSLVIYTGNAEPRRDQPVVAASGLVGRVVLAVGRYARVQLITDRASAVSAMIRRNRRQGIARGDGKQGLDLLYLPLQSDVRPGDEVVTAGMDGIFPRDIAIGTVSSVEPGTDLFHRIKVAPAIDLLMLDQVDVLTMETVPAEIKEALAGADR